MSKYLLTSFGGGLITFLMSFVSLIICLYIVPDITSSINPIENLSAAIFHGDFYISHPFLYGFAISLWRFLIGFLIASFGFALSMFIKNLFIIFTLPFVYSILENFILSVLGLEHFRLFTSFWPMQLNAKSYNIWRFASWPYSVSNNNGDFSFIL